MHRINALNNYLGNYRKYLLIVLNVVLVIFIILEVMIWNQVNGLISEEEYQRQKLELCKSKSYTESGGYCGNIDGL